MSGSPQRSDQLPDISRASLSTPPGGETSRGGSGGSPTLPLPILKKHHPASSSPSPRNSSPPLQAVGEGFASHMNEANYSPVNPSPLRSATSVGADHLASVTFSEPKMPPSITTPAPASSNLSTPIHSILKTSSTPSSRRNSVSEADISPYDRDHVDAGANARKLDQALLQLPNSQPPTSSSSSSSHIGRPGVSSGGHRMRSASPSADRSRIVGKGGYGGRRGGPSLLKSRTSSSGGLSDVDMRPGYERKVGFDTMVDAEDTPNGYFTFCLQVKSLGYRRTKNTRTFMCAVDDNAHSERALEWLMESLVSDGDEVVATRIIEDRNDIDQDLIRDEARELMASIVELNDEVGHQSISIVVEFVAVKDSASVTNSILGYVYMYRPDSLTVGTRGKTVSAFQRMVGTASIGSISRELLNRCPVPLVIVRPEFKVKKHLAKRQNDPKRRSYHDLVALERDSDLPLSVGSRRSSRILPHGLPFGRHD